MPETQSTSAGATAAAPFALKPRLDRFFPLRDAFSCVGSEFLDVIVWIPPGRADGSLRLWLKTEAQSPEIQISGKRFRPVARSKQDARWVDFGLIGQRSPELGTRGFANLRVYGVSAAQARESCVVFTPQAQIELAGEVPDVERALCGLARQDVGRTTLSPCRVVVKSSTAFEMTYVAGPRGLPDGTLLRLAFAKAFSLPQTSDRHGPGWIKATETPGRLELASIGQSIESHERVDVIYRLPDGLPSCGRLAFRYRTDFVYLFPSRWAQMERRYWWDPLPPMALAVAVDERHVFVPPLEENGHALEVMAGPPERLHLFLPGRVREGSSTRLTGVFTDRYRNAPSPGPLPSPIHLRLCGEDNRDLGSADGHFDRWYRFALPLPALRPGVYRAQACDSRTGAVLAESNPMEMMRRGDSRSPIFWGEIHAHSEQSDGSGRFEHIYLHGRDEGALDFAAGADHACYFTDNEWTWMQDITNSFNDEPRFVTLVGYEWAGEQGHRNVYTSRDRLDLFRGMDTSSHRLNVVYDHFAGRDDVVAGPHVHHVGKDFFAHHNPDVQRFFEIYSMWGNYERLVFQALNGGAVIGVTGGGDCHEARAGFSVEDPAGQGQTPHTFAPGLRWKCGMTAALLPELTRQALLRALRERQTYATSGARILVDFEVSRVPMGGTGETSGAPRVSALVHGVSRIGRVDVIRNGEVVHSAPGQGADLLLSWSDGSAPRGTHWYMLRIVQQDDEIAWTSPLWLTVR